MNKIMQRMAFIAACMAAATSSVVTAEVPVARLSSATMAGSHFSRQGPSTKGESNLFGAPVLIYILGAIAITIGTITIVDNGNGSKSP